MRRTVYVVGPDGKVQYRNTRFNALDRASTPISVPPSAGSRGG